MRVVKSAQKADTLKMTIDSMVEISIFLAAQTLAAVAAFFTLRTDVGNLKEQVKDIAADTKQAALHIAGLPCRPGQCGQNGD
jgi:L-alanine-DL-glutamate epimerase-like enolase superfamily enzyme